MNLSQPVYNTSDHSLQSGDIYYANADYIGVPLQPVKMKHMASHT